MKTSILLKKISGQLFMLVLASLFSISLKVPESSEYKNFDKLKAFNFEFSFGVGAKNQINTFKHRFTKDLIILGTCKTKLRLTKEEMQEIYELMKKIDIMNYPSEFKPLSESTIEPYDSYILKLKIDKTEKVIKWNDESMSQENKAKELRILFARIQQIIYSKREYKEMPSARGGYK